MDAIPGDARSVSKTEALNPKPLATILESESGGTPEPPKPLLGGSGVVISGVIGLPFKGSFKGSIGLIRMRV